MLDAALMPPITVQAEVSKIVKLTHDVRELTFRLKNPATLDFIAGQYVNFRIVRPDQPKPASRMYSIGSAPSESGVLRLVYNYVGGPGTTYLDALQIGETVECKAPFGHFVLDLESTRDVAFVATGTGVAPFYSMLLEYLPKNIDRKMTLVWGVREPRDLYYQAELDALKERYANFHYAMAMSRGDWRGTTGRVTAIFPKIFPTLDNLEVYICGSTAMITDMKSLCDAAGGCPFHREKYF